jgi:2-hydroxy-6-oxo-6-(2'-aminophenyl)hexa-2,4-dienoate hydrolase
MAGFESSLGEYQSKFVDASGIRTHYIEAGSAEPIMLIHGGGPGADGYGNWHSCIPRYARHFRVIAVDMLGFGKTQKPSPETFTYSQDARTDHLIAFIEAMGIDRVNLIGNSMGGCTALGLCMKRPDLAKKLVLMGSAGIKTAGIPAALAPLVNYDGTREGMQKVISVLTHANFRIDDAMLRYRLDLSNEPENRKALAATMQWVKSRHGLYYDEADIRRVKTPSLVVGGKDDPIVLPEHNYKFLELLENSWGYFIPHCGHWVMMEYPEEFTEVTTRFIRQ